MIITKETINKCPKCKSKEVWFNAKTELEFCKQCDTQWTIKPIKWRLTIVAKDTNNTSKENKK